MICPNCGSENKGVTIKGSLFCIECGDKLSQSTEPSNEPKTTDSPQTSIPTETKEEPTTVPVAQVISKNGEIEKEISLLEAEVAALEIIEDEALEIAKETRGATKPPISELKESKISIKKVERPRITSMNKAGFRIIPNEPDPLTQEELESPHDMIIQAKNEPSNEPVAPLASANMLDLSEKTNPENNQKSDVQEEAIISNPPEDAPTEVVKKDDFKETKPTFDALQSAQTTQEENIFVKRNKERAEEETQVTGITEEDLDKKTEEQRAKVFFSGIFKHNPKKDKTVDKKKRIIKKNKPHSKISRLKIIVITAIVLTALVFLAIGFYVNLYALNPQKTITILRNQTNISFKEPSYLPPGYTIEPSSSASNDKINLIYQYTASEKKNLTITLEATVLTKDELFDNRIKNSGSGYLNFDSYEISFWYIDNSKLLFIDKGYLYEISSSVTMSKEELLNIAEGVIIDQNISS